MAAVLYWQALPVGTMSFKGTEAKGLNLSKVASWFCWHAAQVSGICKDNVLLDALTL